MRGITAVTLTCATLYKMLMLFASTDHFVGRESSVDIATLYGLHVPGIESLQIPVAERFKARIGGRSLAWIVGLNPVGGMDECLF